MAHFKPTRAAVFFRIWGLFNGGVADTYLPTILVLPTVNVERDVTAFI